MLLKPGTSGTDRGATEAGLWKALTCTQGSKSQACSSMIRRQLCTAGHRCATYCSQCSTGGSLTAIRLLTALQGMPSVLTCNLSAQHSLRCQSEVHKPFGLAVKRSRGQSETSLVLYVPAWMCTKAQLPDRCPGKQPLRCTVLRQIRPLCQESLHSPLFNPRQTL